LRKKQRLAGLMRAIGSRRVRRRSRAHIFFASLAFAAHILRSRYAC
jgi:hypothetical protein